VAKTKWDWDEEERQAFYNSIDEKIEGMQEIICNAPVIPDIDNKPPNKMRGKQQRTIEQLEHAVTLRSKLWPDTNSQFKASTATGSTPAEASILPTGDGDKKTKVALNPFLTAEQIEAKLRKLEAIIKGPNFVKQTAEDT